MKWFKKLVVSGREFLCKDGGAVRYDSQMGLSDSEKQIARDNIGVVSSAVESVNGQTGEVVLDASDVGALPDSYQAPVQSVNGQTGNVTVSVPVQSVNGETGNVVLDASDVGALPDSYVAPVQSVNGETGAVVLDANDVGALPNTYVAPVQSVNGETGAVVLDANDVGALPNTYVAPVQSVNGQTGSVSLDADDVGAVAYFKYVDTGTDLNTVTTSGFYILRSSLVNAPTGADYSQMIVSRGSDTIAQMIFIWNTSDVYVRTGNGIGGNNPTWQSWRLIGSGGSSNIYPVGAIYISVINTDPSNFFGGTWERIQDMFLLAAGTTYAGGTTGGEAEHTLTVNEMPAHGHTILSTHTSAGVGFWASNTGSGSNWTVLTGQTSGSRGYPYAANTGGDTAHNNMPPYLAVYVWKRVS